MTACPESQAWVKLQYQCIRIRCNMPARHNPNAFAYVYGLELRLRQAHPVLFGDCAQGKRPAWIFIYIRSQTTLTASLRNDCGMICIGLGQCNYPTAFLRFLFRLQSGFAEKSLLSISAFISIFN